VIEAFPFEDVEEVTPYGAGLVEKARVKSRLATASLAFGVDHLHPKPPQYANHANAYLGVYLVNITRNEQGHPQYLRPFRLVAASHAKYSNANRPGYVMRC